MTHTGWQVHSDRGFLLSPDPLRNLSEGDHTLPPTAVEEIESLTAELPHLLTTGRLRAVLDAFPVFDVSDSLNSDGRVVERLALLYGYFANAYVYADTASPSNHLPASVAAPLVQVSQRTQRPPILSYATMALGNWQRTQPDRALVLENVDTLVTFSGLPDEHWFLRVHVAIEAQAATLLQALQGAAQAIADDDSLTVHDHLRTIHQGIMTLIKTFHRMPEGCDPDVYYQQVRPYIVGFTNVVYEGVAEYEGKPQNWRGGSGAQSSIVPALVAALGIRHTSSELTHHLTVMQAYMPLEHRHFIANLNPDLIRDYVKQRPPLADAYNACLRQLITFRRAHFYYAKTYIFEKSPNAIGTGGTPFMDFLTRLVEETEAHLL